LLLMVGGQEHNNKVDGKLDETIRPPRSTFHSNRHIFIADFWNSATATNGCLAAGRAGGYFHVNWNGDVSPCVFFPYSPINDTGRVRRCVIQYSTPDGLYRFCTIDSGPTYRPYIEALRARPLA
jgi:MoaA/NifB/PqqE/SkfB family radical SAM enzyme